MKPTNRAAKTFVVISLTSIFLLSFSTQSFSEEKECKATVDMADSLEFHRMHMECNQDKKFGSKVDNSNLEKPAHEETAAKPMKAEVSEPSTRINSDVFEESEPFALNSGPESARLSIFKRMAEKCPNGWEQHQELVKPVDQGYLLSYRFSCL